MAHFAELDENNKVLRVTCVGNDEVAYNGDPAGETYCTNLLGGTWKQTSYNTRQGVHYDPNTWIPSEDQSKAFRWNYAGKDFTYDPVNDVFIPPQDFPSWTLDSNYVWQAPVTFPSIIVGANNVQLEIYWNEDTLAWNANPYPQPAPNTDTVPDKETILVWNPDTSSWS